MITILLIIVIYFIFTYLTADESLKTSDSIDYIATDRKPTDFNYDRTVTVPTLPEILTDNKLTGQFMSAADKHTYLTSENWRMLRRKVLQRDNYQCVTCHSTANLNIHHITYIDLGDESLDQLTTLCATCHTDLHNTLGYDRETTYPPKVYHGTN